MDEVTRILQSINEGDSGAADKLLPLVYEELRKLAARRLSNEVPGQTLQPTALVHEAFLRLVDSSISDHWNSRGHFFGAAAEAMRRILVENARRKSRVKHGGQSHRVAIDPQSFQQVESDDQVLALNDALETLEAKHPEKAAIVKLRYFAGLTNAEAAELLGISTATAQRHWLFARVWLFGQLSEG
jgi:RNA polymerase sigma factor (TIGR02999 family)